jgi:hypothetical protein
LARECFHATLRQVLRHVLLNLGSHLRAFELAAANLEQATRHLW